MSARSDIAERVGQLEGHVQWAAGLLATTVMGAVVDASFAWNEHFRLDEPATPIGVVLSGAATWLGVVVHRGITSLGAMEGALTQDTLARERMATPAPAGGTVPPERPAGLQF